MTVLVWSYLLSLWDFPCEVYIIITYYDMFASGKMYGNSYRTFPENVTTNALAECTWCEKVRHVPTLVSVTTGSTIWVREIQLMRRTVPRSLYRPGPREINSGSSWQLKNRGSIVGRSTLPLYSHWSNSWRTWTWHRFSNSRGNESFIGPALPSGNCLQRRVNWHVFGPPCLNFACLFW